MWYDKSGSPAIITAPKRIAAAIDGKAPVQLPKTAVLVYMHSALELARTEYDAECITQSFPRFLYACPIYRIKQADICLLDGGRGAPMAVDTLETLAALGVKNVLSVGMCGAYDSQYRSGDILLPERALSEEGTSRHYFENTEIFHPDGHLHRLLREKTGGKPCGVVSTDSVYRQTFGKEAYWRSRGFGAVDMETSALFGVGSLLGVRVASALLVSDVHPLEPGQPDWHWHVTPDMRRDFAVKCLEAAFAAEECV